MSALVRGLLCFALLLPGLAAAAGEAPFFWQIDGPKSRHYLIGSLHLLPEAASKLPPTLEQAYAASEELVFESDIAALATPELQLRLLMSARGERPLKAALAPALYARLVERAAEVGMPMALCEPFKPWFCGLSLEIYDFQHQGFRPELGLDQQFYQRALASQKPVHWLEDPEDHLALFTAMSEAQSEQFLVSTLDQLNEAGGSPADMLRVWQSGDGAPLEKLIADFRRKAPAIYERLLAGRNRAWLPRLAPRLDGARAQLVVVGAAHLYGPDGLVTLLQQKGYRVQPLPGPADSAPAELPAPAPAPQSRLGPPTRVSAR